MHRTLAKLADKLVLLVAVLSIFAAGFACGFKFYQVQDTETVITGLTPGGEKVFQTRPVHRSWWRPSLPYE